MTKRAVLLTATAARDINDAKTWLQQSGARHPARTRYQAILRAIQSLRAAPMRYRRDPEAPERRIVSVAGYRIVYEVMPDTGDNATAGDVTVLAVLGPGEP